MEIGIEMRCRSLAIVHEHFWNDNGTPIREYGFYFIVEPKDATLVAPLPVQSLEGHLKFQWFSLDRIKGLNFVPQVLKTRLSQLDNNTMFISTLEIGTPSYA